MYNVQIIMSTYNGEKYLKEQIESIFLQEECNIKLLIRDDGSTDKTIELIEELKKVYNIELIKGENLGPAKSFLEALKKTDIDIDYFAFSDQDDIWKKDKLKRAIKKIQENESNFKVYISNLCAVDKNMNIINKSILPTDFSTEYKDLLIKSSYIFGCTMVFDKKTRDYVNSIEYKNPIMHDLWIALLVSLKGIIIYDDYSSILYRQHGSNQVGAQMTIYEKMKNRIKFLKGKDRGNISNQANDLLSIIHNDNSISPEIVEYTKLIANYDKSLKNKILLIKSISKKSMTKKQRLFFVVLVLLGNV